jgi:hypothetical protein
MSKRICHPGTNVPIVTGNLRVDSTRVKTRKKKVLVPGQAPATGPAQVPFGPQLPTDVPQAIPVPTGDGSGKVVLVGHTPAALPSKIRYEDIANVSTRHHIGKGASLAPKMPAAAILGRVHRARKGAGITRRMNR